jgi:hypothetical protein
VAAVLLADVLLVFLRAKVCLWGSPCMAIGWIRVTYIRQQLRVDDEASWWQKQEKNERNQEDQEFGLW